REEDFDQTLAVNLKGTFFTSQAAGRVMIRQGYGRIVNVGSQAGVIALPGESVYCMTKAAIAHLTKCLAVEWGPHGITVNAVALTCGNLDVRTPVRVGSSPWSAASTTGTASGAGCPGGTSSCSRTAAPGSWRCARAVPTARAAGSSCPTRTWRWTACVISSHCP